MDGFGASSAWTANNISDAEADLLFSPTAGIGLSLLRVQIKPEGITQEMGTARKAFARGAAVWAAPWSPPGAWKTTGTTQMGGYLRPEYLAGLGRPARGIRADDDRPRRCRWWRCRSRTSPASSNDGTPASGSPPQLVEFVRDYLGPALAARGLSTPIMAPETQNWTLFGSYASAFANDAGAMQYLGVFAAHNYGGSPHTVDAVQATGKPVWQTEVSDSMPLDVGMGSALKYGEMIHQNLVAGRVSAWHYWWLRRRTDQSTNSALLEAGQLTRRAYVLGNWSRFVRPGAMRVAATATPQAYVYVTAFIDPTSDQLAIVAVNDARYALDQGFTIAGGTVAEVTPWLTSARRCARPQAPVPSLTERFRSRSPPAA